MQNIVKRETGYWAEYGDSCRFFEFTEYGTDAQTRQAAERYVERVKTKTDPEKSKSKVALALSSLEALVQSVRNEFPLSGRKEDFFFYLDQYDETIVVRFGSLNVYVNDKGLFGAELIVNWLTREPVRICSNLTLSAMSEFLKGTQGSRTYTDFCPTELYLDKNNVDFISTRVKLPE